MALSDVRRIVKKYVDYMIDPENEYSDETNQREQEIQTIIKDKTYKGHTKQAIKKEVKYLSNLIQGGDEDLLEEKSKIVLSRSNIKDEYELLSDKDKKIFIWELLKGELATLEFERVRNLKRLKPDISHQEIYSYMNDNHHYIQAENNIQETKNDEPEIFQSLTIRELTSNYIEEKRDTLEWSDRNEEDINYILELFAETNDNKGVNLLTRDNFTYFRNCILSKLPVSNKSGVFKDLTTLEIIDYNETTIKKDTISKTTINKHLGRVHQVFEWGYNNSYVNHNLSKDLRYKIKKNKQDAKVAFSDDDLEQIFNHTDVFTTDLIKTLRYKPSRIFVPLLTLYSAGRNDEICQLYLEDIKEIDGTYCMDINDDLDKKIKADSTSRVVPIHSDLIELGFLQYHQYLKDNNEVRLFPELKMGKNGYSTNFTPWFSLFKNTKFPQWGKTKTFYSFKHYFINDLKQKAVPLHFINGVAGHVSDNIDSDLYGDELSLENKISVIRQFSTNLDLTHIEDAISNIYG